MLVVHCDENHSYEITMKDYEARKIKEKFSFNFVA